MRYKVSTTCAVCIHEKVCKYREEVYKYAVKEIENGFVDHDIDGMEVAVDFHCKHFDRLPEKTRDASAGIPGDSTGLLC